MRWINNINTTNVRLGYHIDRKELNSLPPCLAKNWKLAHHGYNRLQIPSCLVTEIQSTCFHHCPVLMCRDLQRYAQEHNEGYTLVKCGSVFEIKNWHVYFYVGRYIVSKIGVTHHPVINTRIMDLSEIQEYSAIGGPRLDYDCNRISTNDGMETMGLSNCRRADDPSASKSFEISNTTLSVPGPMVLAAPIITPSVTLHTPVLVDALGTVDHHMSRAKEMVTNYELKYAHLGMEEADRLAKDDGEEDLFMAELKLVFGACNGDPAKISRIPSIVLMRWYRIQVFNRSRKQVKAIKASEIVNSSITADSEVLIGRDKMSLLDKVHVWNEDSGCKVETKIEASSDGATVSLEKTVNKRIGSCAGPRTRWKYKRSELLQQLLGENEEHRKCYPDDRDGSSADDGDENNAAYVRWKSKLESLDMRMSVHTERYTKDRKERFDLKKAIKSKTQQSMDSEYKYRTIKYSAAMAKLLRLSFKWCCRFRDRSSTISYKCQSIVPAVISPILSCKSGSRDKSKSINNLSNSISHLSCEPHIITKKSCNKAIQFAPVSSKCIEQKAIKQNHTSVKSSLPIINNNSFRYVNNNINRHTNNNVDGYMSKVANPICTNLSVGMVSQVIHRATESVSEEEDHQFSDVDNVICDKLLSDSHNLSDVDEVSSDELLNDTVSWDQLSDQIDNELSNDQLSDQISSDNIHDQIDEIENEIDNIQRDLQSADNELINNIDDNDSMKSVSDTDIEKYIDSCEERAEYLFNQREILLDELDELDSDTQYNQKDNNELLDNEAEIRSDDAVQVDDNYGQTNDDDAHSTDYNYSHEQDYEYNDSDMQNGDYDEDMQQYLYDHDPDWYDSDIQEFIDPEPPDPDGY